MHFAAESNVDRSFKNNFIFTTTNVLGTHVLLEVARLVNIKLFLHVSTDEVYGDGIDGISSSEESILSPTNPYSASKAAAEQMVMAYHRSYKVPVIITRGNNVFGPHKYPENIIPKFMSQLHLNQLLTIHGNGENWRNYIYVKDAANAFDTILHKGEIGSIYNIGGEKEISNLELAYILLQLFKKIPTNSEILSFDDMRELMKPFVTFINDRPFNDIRYHVDCSKLKELGWKEECDWNNSLIETKDWYSTGV